MLPGSEQYDSPSVSNLSMENYNQDNVSSCNESNTSLPSQSLLLESSESSNINTTFKKNDNTVELSQKQQSRGTKMLGFRTRVDQNTNTLVIMDPTVIDFDVNLFKNAVGGECINEDDEDNDQEENSDLIFDETVNVDKIKKKEVSIRARESIIPSTDSHSEKKQKVPLRLFCNDLPDRASGEYRNNPNHTSVDTHPLYQMYLKLKELVSKKKYVIAKKIFEGDKYHMYKNKKDNLKQDVNDIKPEEWTLEIIDMIINGNKRMKKTDSKNISLSDACFILNIRVPPTPRDPEWTYMREYVLEECTKFREFKIRGAILNNSFMGGIFHVQNANTSWCD